MPLALQMLTTEIYIISVLCSFPEVSVRFNPG